MARQNLFGRAKTNVFRQANAREKIFACDRPSTAAKN
jgi:hypothetical protein